MNDTLKVIVGVLETGKPELQVAAAQILGELHSKEPAVVRALAAAMRRSHVLARFAVDALAKVGGAEAWSAIAAGLLEQESLAEHCAHLLAEAGPGVHPILAASYEQALGEQRLRVLAILVRHLTKESLGVFVHALLTPETTERAASLLLAAADQFQAPQQKLLREGLGKHLQSALPETCLAHVLVVLARVDAVGSRALLLQHTAAESPPLVRSAALRSLRGSKLTSAQVTSLMEVLEDPSQKDVHDAVRDVLAQLPEVPEGLLPVLKRLLLARAPEQRLFALRMLRTAGGAEMAKVALKLLDHPDERFRAAAADALAHNKQAVEPLTRLVQVAQRQDLQQAAAEVLRRHARQFTPKVLRQFADKAAKLLSAHTRTADLLLDVVLPVADPKLARDLVDKGVRLRRARRPAEALHLFARIAATPLGDDETRFQLAITKLMVDLGRPTAEAAAPGNPTMGFFAALVRGGFPLFERLRKEPSVTPEALLHIATHFADAVGDERRFATDLLRHLATRTKGRAGEEAKLALRVTG
jgi:hypothetical protein